ncbi:hypothetical protein ACFZAG_29840 [Streptomyces sp. NPDC012403]|uniref:hypothetical protein n=1 Tax=Streptomyces sp. NPDC012403 TaxID=3364831 RepID=UPI0036EAD7E4
MLAAGGVRPRSVSPLPDRGSRIPGLAAAGVLDLPAEPYEAGRQDTVVIAHDLGATADEEEGPRVREQLRHRAPGQVLHEHACCWTDPPAATAASVTLLHQSAVAPGPPASGGAPTEAWSPGSRTGGRRRRSPRRPWAPTRRRTRATGGRPRIRS